MNDTKPRNIENIFTSKVEIDKWYKQSVDGLTSILDIGVNKWGVNSLGNFSRYIRLSFENLGLAKKTAYQVCLSTRLDDDEIISYEDVIKKYF